MNKKNGTIYKKMARLEELMSWFESDNFVLQESLDKFAEAEKLAFDIEEELTTFQNQVTILQRKFSEK